MEITICKWKRDANSPVLLMVDNISNTWIDKNSNGRVDLGEDLGYAGEGPNSSLRFLKDEILADFPMVKVTFFVSVDSNKPIRRNYGQAEYSSEINEDGVAAAFFRKLSEEELFEVAYRGRSFSKTRVGGCKLCRGMMSNNMSLQEAEDNINWDKVIFRSIFGRYPDGGKSREIKGVRGINDSLRESGFKWWSGKASLKGKKNCDVSFVEEGLPNIPITLSGDIFNGIKGKKSAAGDIKPAELQRKTKRLWYLLDNKLVIGIQESAASFGADRRKRGRNIYDDRDSLRLVLSFLKNKQVWYCKASELAQYCRLRENLKILCSGSRFNFNYAELAERKIINPRKKTCKKGYSNEITLKLNEKLTEIILPDGSNVRSDDNSSFTIPIMDGDYTVSFIEGGRQSETCYTYCDETMVNTY